MCQRNMTTQEQKSNKSGVSQQYDATLKGSRPLLANRALQLLFVLMVACLDEEQTLPVAIKFATDKLDVIEGTTVSVSLILESPALEDGTVELSINTDALYSQHYTISPEPIATRVTINIEKGRRSMQFRITSLDNNTAEALRVLTFSLERASAGFRLGSPSRLVVTIREDDNNNPPGPETPVADFGGDHDAISEADSPGKPISIYLSKYIYDGEYPTVEPTTAIGNVVVKFVSGNAMYGEEFTTLPAAAGDSILLKFTGTQTDTSFTVVPIDNNNLTDSRFILISISKVSGNIQIGSTPHYWLEIKDDENGPAQIKWTKLESPVNANIQSAVFHNENFGYLVSDDKLIKTEDGGLHWIGMIPDPLKSYIHLIPHFINDQIAFMGGTEYYCDYYSPCYTITKIFKTVNGGTTWTTVKNFNSDFVITSLHFISESTGLIGTSLGQILKTVDGGVTWTSYPSAFDSPVSDLVILSTGTGYVRTNNRILQTLNFGDTWRTSFQTPGNSIITSLAVSSSNLLFASWSDCNDLPSGFRRIYKSDDAINWSPVSDCILGESLAFSATAGLGVSIGPQYWGQWPPTIRLSRDNGSSWILQPLPEGHNAIRDVAIASDKVIYAVGDYGLILKGVVE